MSNADAVVHHVDVVGNKVVDVGCGAGELVRFLRRKGADAVGVECGEVMRQRALDADPENHHAYVDGVGQDLPFDDQSVDVVIFSYSLHHVPADHMEAAVAESYRVLAPGGILYVAEPEPHGPGFEASKHIDDETVVRGLAQDALDTAPSIGFTPTITTRYATESVYRDFAEWEHVIVGIDPSRAEQMANQRERSSELFHSHGEKRADGYVFGQAITLRVFSRDE